MKKNTHIFRILGHTRAVYGKGVLTDETVAFALEEAQESYPDDLRLVTYHDDEHNETYQFLTDEFRLSALNIALVYKNRWQIELFLSGSSNIFKSRHSSAPQKTPFSRRSGSP